MGMRIAVMDVSVFERRPNRRNEAFINTNFPLVSLGCLTSVEEKEKCPFSIAPVKYVFATTFPIF